MVLQQALADLNAAWRNIFASVAGRCWGSTRASAAITARSAQSGLGGAT